MSSSDFFEGIAHPEVPWREYLLHVPVFYPDIQSMSIMALVPLERIRAVLPSDKVFPYRVTPKMGLVALSAFKYIDSDVGTYNEIGLSIPVAYGKPTKLFTGTFRKPEKPYLTYSHWLPVTTEIARAVGAEFAGYPKFVADIQFSEDEDWILCQMMYEGKHVLTMRGRKLPVHSVNRSRLHILTFRDGRFLRSELIQSEHNSGSSKGKGDVELTFGDHPMAEMFRTLGFDRIVNYTYNPRSQGILTPVIESLPG